MNKIQFDKVLKPLIEIYDEIELDIIRDILFRLDNYRNVQGTLDWYLEKLAELGTIENDTLNILKKNKNEIKKVLEKIVNSSAISSEYLDILNNYYEKGLLDIKPLELYEGRAINNLINNAINDTDDILSLIDTKVLEETRESYKKILNKAYIETSSGIYSYQKSIKRALEDFAKEGIKTVHYASGKTMGIESVVRRDVITRINKLIGDIDIQNAKSLDTNLVYVSQHLGARVRTKYTKHDYEAHAEWQGKVYMLVGSSEKYDNFYEKTGYGEMLGLKGINCYHDFRPYFEWEDIPKKINMKKNKKQYELFQKQRLYERKIRRLKREKEVYKQIDKDEYKRTSNKLKMINNEYNEFIKKNNLNRDYFREYVNTKIPEIIK